MICAVIYVVSQLILVFRTLEDRWPIGDIIFGTAFFTFAQILLFAFSAKICDAIKHYIDGLFFFTLCMLLSVMMVYKYWDSITVRRVCSITTHSLSHLAVLSAGGSRVFCRLQGGRVGSQGPTSGRTRRRICGGCCEQLPRCTGQPRGRYQRKAALPAEGIWTWLPTIVGQVLTVDSVIDFCLSLHFWSISYPPHEHIVN